MNEGRNRWKFHEGSPVQGSVLLDVPPALLGCGVSVPRSRREEVREL
jgi:hypothetical protein